jgi:hypothetical protein
MSVPEQSKTQPVRKIRSDRIWFRVAVVVLLVAVTGLSTLAKNCQYLPNTNPAQYVSNATKMKAVHPLIVPDGGHQQSVIEISVPRPTIRLTREDRFETKLVPPVSVIVSMQHRSPPITFAWHSRSFQNI